jgi:hypothetical protein
MPPFHSMFYLSQMIYRHTTPISYPKWKVVAARFRCQESKQEFPPLDTKPKPADPPGQSTRRDLAAPTSFNFGRRVTLRFALSHLLLFCPASVAIGFWRRRKRLAVRCSAYSAATVILAYEPRNATRAASHTVVYCSSCEPLPPSFLLVTWCALSSAST